MRKDKQLFQERSAHILKTVRAKNKWTQRSLADAIGCSLSQVERLESRTNCDNTITNSVSELRKYADVCGMKAVDFLAYVEGHEAAHDDPVLNSVLEKINKLDIKSQVKLMTLIEKNRLEALEKALELTEMVRILKKDNQMDGVYRFISSLTEILDDQESSNS